MTLAKDRPPRWFLVHLSISHTTTHEMWSDRDGWPRRNLVHVLRKTPKRWDVPDDGTWRIFDLSKTAMDRYQRWRKRPEHRFRVSQEEVARRTIADALH